MSQIHRIQEKLADRFSFIQYPNIRPADKSTREASRTGFRFKHQMPILDRMFLFFMSIALLLFGLAALAVACFIFYALLF